MNANFLRMIAMAEEVFDARHDAEQLQVDEKVINQLLALHPASVSELDEGEGPCIWILLIPTTNTVMERFLSEEIGEQELLDLTTKGGLFDAIYLCSAMVLPEYRRKGLALSMTLDAINSISTDHPIRTLFVWPFTNEGLTLSSKLAKKTGLELKVRTHQLA